MASASATSYSQPCSAASAGCRSGPLATYDGWKAKGRHVRRGERALSLWRPIAVKRTVEDDDEPQMVTRFILKPFWFTLAQTDGPAVDAAPLPDWDRGRALRALQIAEIPFDLLDGNVQGFARGRAIAVSPVAAMPAKTTFHEVPMSSWATRTPRSATGRICPAACARQKRSRWR
jgi:hypothetical protein